MLKKVSDFPDKRTQIEVDRKIRYKLNSIKTDFEIGKVKSFEQIFAIIGPSVWAKLMHMGYNTFLKKSSHPGDFSNNELVRFSELIDIDTNIIIKFIFTLMKFKNHYKEGKNIRV